MTTHTRFYPNLRGQVTDQVEQAIQRLYEYVYSLQSLEDRIEAVRRIAEAAGKKADPVVVRRELQIGGRAPLNVSLLLGAAAGAGLTAADVRRLIWWIARNSVQGATAINNRGAIRDTSGRYVVVTEGNDCIRSTDGITWSRVLVVPAPNNSQFRWIDVNGGVIGTCDINQRVYKSVDGGATWTVVGNTGGANSLGMIHYATGTTWVAASNINSARVYRSTNNNDSWAESTTPVITTDIAFDGTTYVFVGSAGSIYTSTDFSAWTSRTSGTGLDIYRIAYSPTLGRFLAVRGSDYMRYSDDSGVTWTAVPIPPSGTWNVAGNGVIWTGSEFWMFIGLDTSRQIARSKDGRYWNWLQPSPGGGSCTGGWFNDGDIAVAVGNSDFIATLGI